MNGRRSYAVGSAELTAVEARKTARRVLDWCQPKIDWFELDIPLASAEAAAWTYDELSAARRLAMQGPGAHKWKRNLQGDPPYVRVPSMSRRKWSDHSWADFVLVAPRSFDAACGNAAGLRLDLADESQSIVISLTGIERDRFPSDVELRLL